MKASQKLTALRKLAAQKQKRDERGRFAATNSSNSPSIKVSKYKKGEQVEAVPPIKISAFKKKIAPLAPELEPVIPKPAPKPRATYDYEAIMERGKQLATQIPKGISSKDPMKRFQAMNIFREKLLKNGGTPSKRIKEIVDEFSYEGLGQREGVVKQFARDFLQIAGEETANTVARSLRYLISDSPRAYANQSRMMVDLSKKITPERTFHEMAHHIEFGNWVIGKAAKDWRDKRATGGIQSLNSLVGEYKYDESEVGVPDKFISPYVGKVYEGRQYSEVVSVGMQHFTTAGNMLTLYEADREHFEFMLGILRPNG